MTQSYRPRATGAAAAVALVLILLTMAACGGDEAAPTTTAPEGFTVASNAKEGFALAIPSDWTQIPLKPNPADFDTTANALRRENPKLASILNQARVLGQSGGKFMAVAEDGVTSVNLTADKAKEKTLQEVVTASIAGLTNVGATNINQEPATLGDKQAIRVTFQLPIQTDDGTVPTDEVQYYVLEDGKAYILTVAGAPAPVSAAVASSLRIR